MVVLLMAFGLVMGLAELSRDGWIRGDVHNDDLTPSRGSAWAASDAIGSRKGASLDAKRLPRHMVLPKRHAARANPNLADLPCAQRGMPSDAFLQSYTATDPRSVQRSRAEQLRRATCEGASGLECTFR